MRDPYLREGESFAGYRIQRAIGSGSYGRVYHAEEIADEVIAADVALKVPHDQDADKERLRREARVWVACSHHPNIARLQRAAFCDGLFYMASEYVPGGTLRQRIGMQPGKPQLRQRKALEITFGVLKALEHLHTPRVLMDGQEEHAIIHRDLKPENILMQEDTPKVTDFGVSATLRSSQGVVSSAGTIAYRAPETFSNRMDMRSDIWSAAVVFYEMLSGRLPFWAENNDAATMHAILQTPLPPLPTCVPEIVQQVVYKALIKDPSRRYGSAKEMREALEEAADASAAGLSQRPVCVTKGEPCCQYVKTPTLDRTKRAPKTPSVPPPGVRTPVAPESSPKPSHLGSLWMRRLLSVAALTCVIWIAGYLAWRFVRTEFPSALRYMSGRASEREKQNSSIQGSGSLHPIVPPSGPRELLLATLTKLRMAVYQNSTQNGKSNGAMVPITATSRAGSPDQQLKYDIPQPFNAADVKFDFDKSPWYLTAERQNIGTQDRARYWIGVYRGAFKNALKLDQAPNVQAEGGLEHVGVRMNKVELIFSTYHEPGQSHWSAALTANPLQ